jgi:hypothetical protein
MLRALVTETDRPTLSNASIPDAFLTFLSIQIAARLIATAEPNAGHS